MQRAKRKVLLFHLGSIGDTIISVPALRAVRAHFGGQAELHLLHEERRRVPVTPDDLLRNQEIGINRFIGYSVEGSSLRQKFTLLLLAVRLIVAGYNSVVYLAPSERTPAQVARDKKFFRWCAIKHFLGFSFFTGEELYPVDAQGVMLKVGHEAKFRLNRLARDGVEVTSTEYLKSPLLFVPKAESLKADIWLAEKRRYLDRPLLAICPGAKKETCLWEEEKFIELGSRICAQNSYEIVVIGGPDEGALSERLTKAWGQGLNAAGHFSVLGSAAVISRCHFLIGLDTGTTHIAAALGIPCVALYADRDNPGRWDPLGPHHLVIRNPVPCSGCRIIQGACPVEGHPCMGQISVQQVWDMFVELQVKQSLV